MNKQGINKYFFCFIFIVFFSSFVAADDDDDDKECDKSKCPGPLAYYNDLDCRPIYKNPGDCCAIKYDCSHLKERSKKKCYVNGNVYEIGENLKKSDALPCDIGCFCAEGFNGIATFRCVIVDCFHRLPKPGCYLGHTPGNCCPGPEVCPTNPATCLVDGKTLTEGAYFQPKDNPKKSCYCKPGYKGENIEPFCYTPKGGFCRPDFRHSTKIHENCAPTYYYEQPPQTSCSVFYRCQNNNDTLISRPETRKGPNSDKTNTCTFGNIVMKIGDELNQATDYSSVCVKCTCEVPPLPTCQRLSDDECDVTKYPPF
ncbi:kielin/chordin-like protein [Leptopilina heterotoma]|uniref:kielin/chordin-like protein n=1 Tax=Leptopilina heterotoma TaxID=63436 RepID=UPI001CA7FFFC|nr:kielin/chordin-like protein [Leptopilina heterotoma]XP_043473197.1 kielin/chordin-like protein [Leptopilina heterotoma]XP_043473198.1 kielin/chordin-like protein [Leptopilina heterotoma]